MFDDDIDNVEDEPGEYDEEKGDANQNIMTKIPMQTLSPPAWQIIDGDESENEPEEDNEYEEEENFNDNDKNERRRFIPITEQTKSRVGAFHVSQLDEKIATKSRGGVKKEDINVDESENEPDEDNEYEEEGNYNNDDHDERRSFIPTSKQTKPRVGAFHVSHLDKKIAAKSRGDIKNDDDESWHDQSRTIAQKPRGDIYRDDVDNNVSGTKPIVGAVHVSHLDKKIAAKSRTGMDNIERDSSSRTPPVGAYTDTESYVSNSARTLSSMEQDVLLKSRANSGKMTYDSSSRRNPPVGAYAVSNRDKPISISHTYSPTRTLSSMEQDALSKSRIKSAKIINDPSSHRVGAFAVSNSDNTSPTMRTANTTRTLISMEQDALSKSRLASERNTHNSTSTRRHRSEVGAFAVSYHDNDRATTDTDSHSNNNNSNRTLTSMERDTLNRTRAKLIALGRHPSHRRIRPGTRMAAPAKPHSMSQLEGRIASKSRIADIAAAGPIRAQSMRSLVSTASESILSMEMNDASKTTKQRNQNNNKSIFASKVPPPPAPRSMMEMEDRIAAKARIRGGLSSDDDDDLRDVASLGSDALINTTTTPLPDDYQPGGINDIINSFDDDDDDNNNGHERQYENPVMRGQGRGGGRGGRSFRGRGRGTGRGRSTRGRGGRSVRGRGPRSRRIQPQHLSTLPVMPEDNDYDPSSSHASRSNIVRRRSLSSVPEVSIPATTIDPVLEATAVDKPMSPEDERRVLFKKLTIGGIISVIIVIIVTIPVTFFFFRKNAPPDTVPPSQTPSLSPSYRPTTSLRLRAKMAITPLLFSPDDALQNDTSPYYRAWEWIAENDRMDVDAFNFAQRYLLAVFYYAMDGDNWVFCSRGDAVCKDNKPSYLSEGSHECEWYGNSCTGDGDWNITNIFFASSKSNGLHGTIPSELFLLTALKHLYIVKNELYGTIPPSIGSLSRLEYLYLYGNRLTGTLPPSFFNMSSIKSISLIGNYLSGTIPPEWARLTNLERIQLAVNDFTGTIPTELGMLEMLKFIDLSHMKHNLNGTIPSSLMNISTMEEVYLFGNKLSGTIPSYLGYLPRLTHYDISDNIMNGTLPRHFDRNSRLQVIHWENNTFTGTIPEELGEVRSLLEVHMENNLLEGEIPEALGNLTHLEKLSMHGNKLYGTMPESLCNLVTNGHLEVLTSDCHPRRNLLSFGRNPDSGSRMVECDCCTECY